MIKSFPKSYSHISNSFHLVNKLSNIHVNNNYTLISLDAISLFTNILTNIDIAINSISKRWSYLKNVICLCLNSYQQCSLSQNRLFLLLTEPYIAKPLVHLWVSPLSLIIADIVMQDLEDWAIKKLDFPPFYIRYVDEIAALSSSLNQILDTFNSFHPRLRFTLEISDNNKLNFLDTTIILENNNLLFDWYHKPLFSGRYLNFLSQHPFC